MAENTIKDIKDYLGCETAELMEVWKSLSDEEKAQWKSADLDK